MRALVIFLVLVCGCGLKYEHKDIEYFKQQATQKLQVTASPYALELFVSARRFDYTDGARFLRSFFDSEDRTFGHAWIRLKGQRNGEEYILQGGHSGERGSVYPRYIDQVIGDARKKEKNPVKYLFQPLDDGYFEQGSGGHTPTFAISIPLTLEQFEAICMLVDEKRYPFSRYSITDGQCTTFVVKAASLAGLVLEHEVTLPVPKTIYFDGEKLTLWEDPRYSSICVATPDRLEESMVHAVLDGKAFYLPVQ